jgi:hypothetical protein
MVCFACNDSRNGLFLGRAFGFSWGTKKSELEFDHIHVDGSIFTVNHEKMIFRIHRVSYPFKRMHYWHGNWCWDAFVMKRSQALRLLVSVVRSGKWDCTGGTARTVDWLEKLNISPAAGKEKA